MFCTYITVHQPTGKYYIGKGKTEAVEKGLYKGSGVLLNNNFKKYPKSEWDCGVLWTFDTAEEAYSDEGGIITQEMLDDPLCLNLIEGGGPNTGVQGLKMTPEQVARNKETQNRPDVVAKNRAARLAYYDQPGKRKEKVPNLGKDFWHVPSHVQKMKKVMSTAEYRNKVSEGVSKPCTVDGVTIYPSRNHLIEALGQGLSGKRSPNFRYIEKETK